MSEECSNYVDRRGAYRDLKRKPEQRHYLEYGGVYKRIKKERNVYLSSLMMRVPDHVYGA
jgi:hypothetical protein